MDDEDLQQKREAKKRKQERERTIFYNQERGN